jgi:hypothetical protein
VSDAAWLQAFSFERDQKIAEKGSGELAHEIVADPSFLQKLAQAPQGVFVTYDRVFREVPLVLKIFKVVAFLGLKISHSHPGSIPAEHAANLHRLPV